MAGINKGGRPRHGAEPKSSSLNLKTTAEVRVQLEEVAAASRRSLTQEVEKRLIDSLEAKSLIPSEPTRSLLRSITTAISIIERKNGADWTENLQTFTAVEAAMRRIVDRRNPGWHEDDEPRLALLRLQFDAAEREYRHSLAEYQAQNPDCPQPPTTLRDEWELADRQYSDAALEGEQVADMINPPALRLHMIPSGIERE